MNLSSVDIPLDFGTRLLYVRTPFLSSQHLRVCHNFWFILKIFTYFICPLELGEHKIYG